jgi:thiamine-phosphate pyrophosphorylase
MSLPQPPLLVVTDRRQARRALGEILEAAFAAGCRWASLRDKDLPPDARVALLGRLRPVARAYGARLTLHGDSALAREAGADGVHLAAGRDPARARKVLGADALIGISVHSPEEAAQLDPAIVDYAVVGAVFATPSKPGYGPIGLSGLRAIVQATQVPVIAIGGIGALTAGDALRAGAHGLAVMGGVMRATDPAVETKAVLDAFTVGA